MQYMRLQSRLIWLICGGLLLLTATATIASQSVQPTRSSDLGSSIVFTGYVVDQANILTPGEVRRLTAQLGRFQRETRHQLAVVTVKSLDGEDVETFTRSLANRWGVGRKEINDGIVLLVAPTDRKARISVGKGLERQLTDAFCQNVMDTKLVPAFRRNDFAKGIETGVSAIIAHLTHGLDARSETR